MVKFNTKDVLQRAAEERAKPKPLPKIIIRKKNLEPQLSNDELELIKSSNVLEAAVRRSREEMGKDLVTKCWHEFNQVKLERNKLSSEIWRIVEAGATKQTLKEHYEKIEAYRAQLQELFDRARHAERFGDLPQEKKNDAGQAVDISSLKYEKKKLTEKRSKLQKKIKLAEATGSDKILEWQLELEQADAMYRDLDERIRKMEGRA